MLGDVVLETAFVAFTASHYSSTLLSVPSSQSVASDELALGCESASPAASLEGGGPSARPAAVLGSALPEGVPAVYADRSLVSELTTLWRTATTFSARCMSSARNPVRRHRTAISTHCQPGVRLVGRSASIPAKGEAGPSPPIVGGGAGIGGGRGPGGAIIGGGPPGAAPIGGLGGIAPPGPGAIGGNPATLGALYVSARHARPVPCRGKKRNRPHASTRRSWLDRSKAART